MAKTFMLVDDETQDLIMSVYNTHQMLGFAQIRVLSLFVESHDKDGILICGIKQQGVDCAASIKIISKKDRIIKNADIELLLDRLSWDHMNEEERKAVISHEFTHIEPKLGKDGAAKIDDSGLVQLKMRRHDLVYWGFTETLATFKNNSVEAKNFVYLQNDVNRVIATTRNGQQHELIQAETTTLEPQVTSIQSPQTTTRRQNIRFNNVE